MTYKELAEILSNMNEEQLSVRLAAMGDQELKNVHQSVMFTGGNMTDWDYEVFPNVSLADWASMLDGEMDKRGLDKEEKHIEYGY